MFPGPSPASPCSEAGIRKADFLIIPNKKLRTPYSLSPELGEKRSPRRLAQQKTTFPSSPKDKPPAVGERSWQKADCSVCLEKQHLQRPKLGKPSQLSLREGPKLFTIQRR
ncbi:hypothetical protein DV515_00010784 [Chloebia gouldiae]|uniref:Uncharacterized protein n=1 Tax=Chloebia gouldiae TaxID=44316 RepID=A0A3L8S8D7_CHLGU|nr:hypothetical protein DV515_00010784 [Chloebia gouldiae]